MTEPFFKTPADRENAIFFVVPSFVLLVAVWAAAGFWKSFLAFAIYVNAAPFAFRAVMGRWPLKIEEKRRR